jgi:alanyl-tRNA synthetase
VTERLYYRDPALIEFEAHVVAQGQIGSRYYSVLDRTAFYPTSGGQLNDLGRLNDIDVIDVIETEDGDIRHIAMLPMGESGSAVHGVVDKSRRRRNRQLHTAQHLISQVFIRLSEAETVSVHLGEEYGAVELNKNEIGESDLAEAERLTNELIADNLPIEILFIDASEIGSIPVRKPPARHGIIRVIKIGEFDWSACGGTHCLSTLEVGQVKIIGAEKLRGHLLVKFLAGSQTLEDYRMRFAITDSLSRALTCHPSDLPLKLDKLMTENKSQHKEIAQLQKELLPIRVVQLAATSTDVDGRHIVAADVGGFDTGLLSQLAQSVADEIHGIAVLLAEGRLVVAVSADSGLHAGDILKGFTKQYGLKGGGNSRVAQAGGADHARLADYRNAILGLCGHA